jgi:Fe-S oxidoreductase
VALEDYRIDMEGCSRCSVCKFIPMDKITGSQYAEICPSTSRYNFHAYSAGGKLNIGLAMLENRLDYTDELLNIVYNCQMCGGCDISCKFARDMEVLEVLQELRIKCVEDGQFLPGHMPMIDSLKKEDNVMQRPKSERGKWAEGLDVKNVTREHAEVYYHAGCRYCYDEELWPAARGAVNLLKKAGVDVGIAGKEEICCGGRAYQIGYQGELTKYAESNMEMMKTAGVKTLVTSCADCYWAFKVVYDEIGKKGNLEVLHITEYLDRLIKEGKLKPTKQVPMKVTYHDPCHLGRLGEPYISWKGQLIPGTMITDPPKEFRRGTDGVYQPPRDILNSITGLKLAEMHRIKEYSWCCGAGGGVKEVNPDFALWTALERIEEAKTTGAEAMITACPWCQRNFRDAIEQSGDRIKIYDVVELLQQAV